MKYTFFIFPVLFFNSQVLAASLLGVLVLVIGGGIKSIYERLNFKKITFILLWLTPIVYIFINLLVTSGFGQLSHVIFYQKDGVFLVTWVLFLFLHKLLSARDYVDNFKLFYLGCVFLIAVSTPINVLNGSHFFMAFFSSHNASAGFVGSLLIFTIYNSLVKKTISHVELFLLTALLLLFFWANSRAFLGGFVLAAIYMLFMMGYVRLTGKGLLTIFIFTFFLVISGYVYSERILFALSGDDYNTETRFIYWDIAITSFLQNPWFGVGFGRLNDSIILSTQDVENITQKGEFIFGERHAHNLILQILSEQGVVGLLITMVTSYFLVFYKNQNCYFGLVVKVMFVYLLGASMFGLNFVAPSTSVFFYFLLAVYWRSNNG